MTRAWTCCPPIIARGTRRGRQRRLYFLHYPYCRATLLRRQTVSVLVEEPLGRRTVA
jgi:hypothetical protein